jgi:hypothetical protein
MMATQLEKCVGKLLEVRVSGTLAPQDYDCFVPEFERLGKEHGKIRVLFDIVDFHGWRAGALWPDLRFEFRRFANIERLALVRDRMWERTMSVFCTPFTTAQIRHFDRADLGLARAWLEGEEGYLYGEPPESLPREAPSTSAGTVRSSAR